MKTKDILLQKNLENFECIINNFFFKKDLNSCNFWPDYLKFAEELKKNIRELKLILEQENSEDVCDCIAYFASNVWKINIHDLNKMSLQLKSKHYTNVLEYLRQEKKEIKFKTFVYKQFFKELEGYVCEHFLLSGKYKQSNAAD